jgi:Na+/H+ antiporter NhaD/arsenite permease-like protein
MRLELTGAVIVLISALLPVVAQQGVTPALAGMSITFALNITSLFNWLVRQVFDMLNLSFEFSFMKFVPSLMRSFAFAN